MTMRSYNRVPQMATGLGADSGSTGQVAVGIVPVQLFNPHRRCAVVITNLGTTDVYIGFNSQVSVNGGHLVPGIRGASIVIETRSPLWAVGSVAGSISWLEFEK
jgi:hypothetical protein